MGTGLDYEQLKRIWQKTREWHLEQKCPEPLSQLIREIIVPPYEKLTDELSPREYRQAISAMFAMGFFCGQKYAAAEELAIEVEEEEMTLCVKAKLKQLDCDELRNLRYRDYKTEEDES